MSCPDDSGHSVQSTPETDIRNRRNHTGLALSLPSHLVITLDLPNSLTICSLPLLTILFVLALEDMPNPGEAQIMCEVIQKTAVLIEPIDVTMNLRFDVFHKVAAPCHNGNSPISNPR